MTTQRTLKKQIRDRMRRNGERYTTARSHVLAGRTRQSKGGYGLVGGQQGDIAAVTNALNAAEIVGPDGSPLTEAQVFGLTGGVGFLYGVFRYDSGPTMTITTRNTSMPDTLLDLLWQTDGLNATVSTTGGAKKAASDLTEAIDNGKRALCSVGAGAMGYLGLPPESSSMYPLVVGVVGREGDKFLVDDRSVEPHAVDADAVAHARAVLRSAKHRMVTIEPSGLAWERITPAAIAAGNVRYGEPPVKQFAKNVGLAGLTKWHHLLTDQKDRMAWSKVFAEGRSAAIGFSRLYECIEHDYTAPAAGRPLYAEFLRWASQVCSTPRYELAADLYAESGTRWSAISALAAESHPSVQTAADKIDLRAELLGENDIPALEQALQEQNIAIDTSELSAATAANARAEMATLVAEIVELEDKARVALGAEPSTPASPGRAKATSGPSDNRVTMLNPNTGREDNTIARKLYDPVKRAVLEAISDIEGIRFNELSAEVESRTDPQLWKKNKVGWYTTSVKLDLEARGLVERFSSPQRLRLTEAGRVAFAETNST